MAVLEIIIKRGLLLITPLVSQMFLRQQASLYFSALDRIFEPNDRARPHQHHEAQQLHDENDSANAEPAPRDVRNLGAGRDEFQGRKFSFSLGLVLHAVTPYLSSTPR